MGKFSSIIIFCVLAINGLQAQKLIKKSFIRSHVSSFQIDASNCFELDLATVAGEELFVEAQIDGEYSKDLIIKITEKGNTIFVSAGFQPNFIIPNDKLSTHKVISIALKINLPEYKNVSVSGTSCSVKVKGIFSDLNVALDDGTCALTNVGRHINVRTQSGNISLRSSRGKILAESQYGNISKDFIPLGDYNIELYSISGDIDIIKSH